MSPPGWIRWLGFALLGIVVAAAVSIAASRLSSQQIGLASEPISAGEQLVPKAASPASPKLQPRQHRRRHRNHARVQQTPAPAPVAPSTTSTPPAPAPPPASSAPAPAPPASSSHASSGDDSASQTGGGSDSLRRRGRLSDAGRGGGRKLHRLFPISMPALVRRCAPMPETDQLRRPKAARRMDEINYVGKWTAFGRAVFVEAGNLSHPLIVGEREPACGLGWRDDEPPRSPGRSCSMRLATRSSRGACAQALLRPSSLPCPRRGFAFPERAS